MWSDENDQIRLMKEMAMRQQQAAQMNQGIGLLGLGAALGMNQGFANAAYAPTPTDPEPNKVLLLTGDDE